MPIYFIGTGQPLLKNKDSYHSKFLSDKDTGRVIREFYEYKKKSVNIPLCIDHSDCEQRGNG